MKIGEDVYLSQDVAIQLWRASDFSIGNNSRVYGGTQLAQKIQIGHNTVIGKLVNFENQVTIGNHVTVYSQSHLTTGLVIGDYAWVGPMFMGLNTKKIRHIRDFELKIEPPTIGRGARIGARVTLMPDVSIGEEAVIDSCSVVTKDVPAREIWRGFPARKVGTVDKNELLDFEQLRNDCELCKELK